MKEQRYTTCLNIVLYISLMKPSRLLSDTFPNLDTRMGFPMTEDADAWLQTLNGKTVRTQLIERQIRRVRATITDVRGHLEVVQRGLCIFLAVAVTQDEEGELAVDQTVDEMASTLGHELGHTFHFDLAPRKLVDRAPAMKKGDRLQRSLESFCEAFSEKWLAIGKNRQQVVDKLERLWDISAAIQRRSKS